MIPISRNSDTSTCASNFTSYISAEALKKKGGRSHCHEDLEKNTIRSHNINFLDKENETLFPTIANPKLHSSPKIPIQPVLPTKPTHPQPKLPPPAVQSESINLIISIAFL